MINQNQSHHSSNYYPLITMMSLALEDLSGCSILNLSMMKIPFLSLQFQIFLGKDDPDPLPPQQTHTSGVSFQPPQLKLCNAIPAHILGILPTNSHHFWICFRLLDISSNSNLLSVLFKCMKKITTLSTPLRICHLGGRGKQMQVYCCN